MMLVSAPYCCAHCGAKYNFFRLYCKACGCVLPAALTHQGEVTQLLSDNQAQPVDVQWGRSYFHRYARLMFVDERSGEVLPIPLDTPSVLIGRTSADIVPAVAFPGLYAAANGISRTHARLDVSDTALFLTDLDSTNGTFLDGQPLTPQLPYALHNRAALQLGKVLLRVQFR
jgi:hypothetical protein